MGFGDFDFICERSPVALCPLVGSNGSSAILRHGTLTQCYARSIEIANTTIFQCASALVHILGIAITIIILLSIRSKYTAIGRKEIMAFFYMYIGLTGISLVVDSGVIPVETASYPYFVSVQNGLSSAVCWCLFLNGLIMFKIYEDGTSLSLWILRISSLFFFIVTFAISLVTVKNWGGDSLDSTNTLGLFIILYIVNGILLLGYVISQICLAIFRLHDLWAVGCLLMGSFFFIVGQVLLYAVSKIICEKANHYIDGLFLATFCNFCTTMMIYKYWDMITKEDLEFSVGNKETNWETSQLLDEDKGYDDNLY